MVTLMAFTSIAQSLVVELLSDIFLKCLPEEGLARIRRKEVPLTVSHVCRHWRFASLSTCRLWARLNLRCATDESTLKYALPILQAFLQRSGSADFYIKIDCAEYVRFAVPKTIVSWPTTEVIFHELARQSDRIKGITLKVPQMFCEKALESSINTLPALDHLSLQFFKYAPNLRPDLDKTFWKVASRLQTLEFKSAVDYTFTPGDIETLALKHLAFSSYTFGALLRMLKSCPALVSLYFNAAKNSAFKANVSEIDRERHWQFPSITSLEIAADDGTDSYMLCAFLAYVRLPNLRRLTVTVRMSDFVESSLEAFLVESRPPLEEFYFKLINDEYFEFERGPSIIEIMKLLPNLKKLRIMLDEEIMRALVLSGGRKKGTCPLLEEVTLDIMEMPFQVEESVDTWAAAEDMIRSRWEAPKSRLSTTSRSRAWVLTHSIAAPRKLRKVILPDIKEEHWKRHQLYKCIKDCQRQSLLVDLRDDGQ